MTIKLLVAIQGAGGVEIPAGTEVTLTDAVEAAHVSANKAVYTTRPQTFDAPPASGVGMKFDLTTGMLRVFAAGVEVPINQVHPAYFSHLYTGNLTSDDGTIYDLSGASGDAVRGANLSITQMQAVAGYATTVVPASGATASMIKLPALNFDFNGGEAMLFYWRGKMPVPSVQCSAFGDSDAALRPGFRVRVSTNGKLDIAINGPTSGETAYGGAAVSVLADNTIHDFAFYIDGSTKKLLTFEDGALVGTTNGFATAGCDTRTTHAFCIGTGYDSPFAGAAYGLNVSMRACAILRWGSGWNRPTTAGLVNAIKKLRSNPSRPLLASDL